MRITHCRTWNKDKNKTMKMKNTESRTWNMARKLTNEENEKSTLYDLEYVKKKKNTEKRGNEKCTL
jgi:hypothetical protein